MLIVCAEQALVEAEPIAPQTAPPPSNRETSSRDQEA